jgi:hypothetical protein
MGNLTNITGVSTIGNIGDLTTPSSTQAYPLGTIIALTDSDYTSVKEYMYVKSHTALTAFQPYVLTFGSTAGAEIVTIAPATLAAPGALVVVPQVAFTSGYYGWVLIKGDGKVLMTSETYAVGDFLQILNTGTALVVDGSTGSTIQLINSCAICKEAGTTAVARKCLLLGSTAVVAAS